MRLNSLEHKVGEYGLPSPRGKDPYKSQSERIIAGMLDRQGIRFTYEDAVYVEDSSGNAKQRIWHPDFHLHDSGVIVEYVGRPADEEYMKGIEKKMRVYEKMGVNVVWLYPEDIWETEEGNNRKREDAEENVLSKIYAATLAASEGEELRDAEIAGKTFDYDYRQTRYAA